MLSVHLLQYIFWLLDNYTVNRFVGVSAKFGTCTVVSVNGNEMRWFKGECAHFSWNKCPIYTLDGAGAKFITNSHETDNSVRTRTSYLKMWSQLLLKLTIGFDTEIYMILYNLSKPEIVSLLSETRKTRFLNYYLHYPSVLLCQGTRKLPAPPPLYSPSPPPPTGTALKKSQFSIGRSLEWSIPSNMLNTNSSF